jgi:dephospho-CoA kinase
MKIILGFVGDLAAGKGTLAKYLQEKYGSNTYRFSNMLRDMLDRIYVEKNRENLQDISTFIRAKFGQDVMSKVIAKDVENDPKEIVVVDGIRRPTDISYLQQIPGFHLVYITADPKLRWERLVARKENPGDENKTYEAFLKDEQAEADELIKELGKQAEFRIVNDASKDELFEKIENILEEIKK